MPTIPSTDTVVVPPSDSITLDRWGVPYIVITTDTTTGRIDTTIAMQRGNESGWSPVPEHRLEFRSSDLVAEVVALNDMVAVRHLQQAQASILALVRLLAIARGLEVS